MTDLQSNTPVGGSVVLLARTAMVADSDPQSPSPLERDILQVVGQDTPEGLLSEVLGRDPAEIVEAVDRLEKAGLLSRRILSAEAFDAERSTESAATPQEGLPILDETSEDLAALLDDGEIPITSEDTSPETTQVDYELPDRIREIHDDP